MIEAVGLYAQSTGQVTTEPNGKMGKYDFLQLLVSQMRHQDPLNPQDASQMAAQMAQFSQLEQMLAMTEAFTGLQQVAMLGRIVRATAVDGTLMEGKVLAVGMNDDTPIMTVELGTLTPTGWVPLSPKTTSFVALKDVVEVTY